MAAPPCCASTRGAAAIAAAAAPVFSILRLIGSIIGVLLTIGHLTTVFQLRRLMMALDAAGRKPLPRWRSTVDAERQRFSGSFGSGSRKAAVECLRLEWFG